MKTIGNKIEQKMKLSYIEGNKFRAKELKWKEKKLGKEMTIMEMRCKEV